MASDSVGVMKESGITGIKTLDSNNTIKILLMDPNARLPLAPAKGDAGFDVFLPTSVELGPMESKVVSLGFKTAIPAGFVAVMKERSGLAGDGLRVGGGVIDSSYRGEWQVVLQNLSNSSKLYVMGKKIAQFLILRYETPVILEVKEDNLGITERGEKGFGSSG